ncbi:hypothetical protein HZS_5469, partial [Henneguya salminicola]
PNFTCVSILNISGNMNTTELFSIQKNQFTAMDDRFKFYDKNIRSIVDMRIRFFPSNPKNISVIFTIKTKVIRKKIYQRYLYAQTYLDLYYNHSIGYVFNNLYSSKLTTKNINTFNIISSLCELFYNSVFFYVIDRIRYHIRI